MATVVCLYEGGLVMKKHSREVLNKAIGILKEHCEARCCEVCEIADVLCCTGYLCLKPAGWARLREEG